MRNSRLFISHIHEWFIHVWMRMYVCVCEGNRRETFEGKCKWSQDEELNFVLLPSILLIWDRLECETEVISRGFMHPFFSPSFQQPMLVSVSLELLHYRNCHLFSFFSVSCSLLLATTTTIIP